MKLFKKSQKVVKNSVVATAMSLLLGACGVQQTNSTTDSVDIPQTSVKNQMKIGFCWAYAITGLLESNYLVQSEKKLNLSEEAIGYYRIRQDLKHLADQYLKGNESFLSLSKKVEKNSFEGWYVLLSEDDRAVVGMKDGMQLVDAYGVVPETVWSIKFKDLDKKKAFIKRLRAKFLDLVEYKNGVVTEDELDALLASNDLFGSKPPQKFVVDGVEMTAQDFTTSVLGFKSTDYATMSASTSEQANILIDKMKEVLAKGVNVPLSFGVKFPKLKDGVFDYEAHDDEYYKLYSPRYWHEYDKGFNGGHAVLVTDFVNIGGKEGALSEKELERELRKPASELSYMLFKNSWGGSKTDEGGDNTNEGGKTVSGSPDGYYRITKDYLRLIGDANFLEIVVPSSMKPSK